MNLGILIILITVLGYISNWLNGLYLNFRTTRWLYSVGSIIHELSHALLCILTGARITEFQILTKQPHVSHTKSRLPLIGQPLISLAPIAGGLLSVYLINNRLLNNYFTIVAPDNINEIVTIILSFLAQINLLHWQSWIMILFFINIGSMIGPSTRDLKNIWPILIILLFVPWPALSNLALVVISLILLNIAIQLIIISLLKIFSVFKKAP